MERVDAANGVSPATRVFHFTSIRAALNGSLHKFPEQERGKRDERESCEGREPDGNAERSDRLLLGLPGPGVALDPRTVSAR